MVQYQNLPLALRLVLHSDDLPIPRLPETWSIDDENESDVKCTDNAQHGLLMENQYDIDVLFEPPCSRTKSHLIS
jgi:hypothetical protein